MQGQGQAAVPAPPDRGADPGTVPLPSPASRTGAASVLSGPSLEVLGTPSLRSISQPFSASFPGSSNQALYAWRCLDLGTFSVPPENLLCSGQRVSTGIEKPTTIPVWLCNRESFHFFPPSSRFTFLIMFAQARVSFHSLRDNQWRMGWETSDWSVISVLLS